MSVTESKAKTERKSSRKPAKTQETVLSALKLYAVSPQKDLNRLSAYAEPMRVSKVLHQYLEVLL